tara:strand:- start:1037 stop:1819 length:783 start_codon:yes stop_codon:yes gene_type:complete
LTRFKIHEIWKKLRLRVAERFWIPYRVWLRLLASLVGRIVILGSLAAGAWWGLHALPDSINPFSPIELTDPVGPLSNVKLRLLQPRYEACLATLKRRGVEVERSTITSTSEDCGMEKGVKLKKARLIHGAPLDMSCGMAAALLIWERQVLVPQSEAMLGSPVTRVRHYGTYACRNMNNAKEGRRSAHATARAIDIAGFDLADGRKISVLRDWGKETPEGQFLAKVHEDACRVFNVVLGPEYNALHANHFHFDMSIWSVCK